MTSPGFSPAFAAGATGSLAVHVVPSAAVIGSTHCETLRHPVSVVDPVGERGREKMNMAMTRFIAGPPSMMTSRLGTERW